MADDNTTHQVEPRLTDNDQKAPASKPAHIMALPPDRSGAKRLRTMPPTWKSGIMFTTKRVQSISAPQEDENGRTVHIFLP